MTNGIVASGCHKGDNSIDESLKYSVFVLYFHRLWELNTAKERQLAMRSYSEYFLCENLVALQSIGFKMKISILVRSLAESFECFIKC